MARSIDSISKTFSLSEKGTPRQTQRKSSDSEEVFVKSKAVGEHVPIEAKHKRSVNRPKKHSQVGTDSLYPKTKRCRSDAQLEDEVKSNHLAPRPLPILLQPKIKLAMKSKEKLSWRTAMHPCNSNAIAKEKLQSHVF